MLIVYPFAFLTGAFGFNVAAATSRNRELRTVSNYLIPTGVAAGLLAAAAGKGGNGDSGHEAGDADAAAVELFRAGSGHARRC